MFVDLTKQNELCLSAAWLGDDTPVLFLQLAQWQRAGVLLGWTSKLPLLVKSE
jgi:hypothetical protein